jgi:hypothetical protein
MRRLVFLFGAAMLALGACRSVPAQAPVQWGCDAPAGRICYFSIQFASGGVRNFSLMSGQRIVVGGVNPGTDRYQVSLDAPNLGDVNRCRQLSAMGRSCQSKMVDSGYND